MRILTGVAVAAVLTIGGLALSAVAYVRITGLRGLPEPGSAEISISRAVRGFAIPGAAKARVNPLAASPDAASPDVIAPGLEHFARYCAVCHGNDGNAASSVFGMGLYPKPPDMRVAPTQQLTDGELFYIIENGIRFTGMPAFGTGETTAAGETQVWQLVTFIRHLPRLTADELDWMKTLNPL